ncbi:hypothetical protein BSL78_06405 [Apostichopus japonicus]|uniref:Multiple myeloma tumor-associated protein 2-like N-terminal domain-containing protein n=1 Tax=Stichopus japonicus TaxID=307972 RepID=A0A2G8L8T7_STIJA|nr:hypothetical protein BSL78_06405 [Apostichopus japonicus]
MAPVGRWQKNKDLQWFSKDKQNDVTGNVSTEIQKQEMLKGKQCLLHCQKVGDRLAAETMKPQTDDSLLKLQRSKPAKRKKKTKGEEKKKGKRKNKEIPKNTRTRNQKGREEILQTLMKQNLHLRVRVIPIPHLMMKRTACQERKHSRGKEHRGGRDRDSYHHRDRLDKNSSRTDRDRRKRGSSRERERKKYYDKNENSRKCKWDTNTMCEGYGPMGLVQKNRLGGKTIMNRRRNVKEKVLCEKIMMKIV